MTKQATDSLDRPALTNVEITPQMIEAGVTAASLYDSEDDLEMVVQDVFVSMLRLLPRRQPPLSSD